MFKRAKKNKKGFTLAEMLIVVAIIAVLVAISIPIFTSQLEKSREAVDAAYIRAGYAKLVTLQKLIQSDLNSKQVTGRMQIWLTDLKKIWILTELQQKTEQQL